MWPVLLVLATLAAVGWAVRDRSRVADVAVGVLPAWVFFAPWLGHLLAHPGRLFTGVDPNAWPDFPPASFALVVGRILPSGLPLWANVTFFAVLALVAVVALARLSGTAWRWAIAGIAAPLVIGTLLSRLVVTVDGGTARVLLSPWALLVVAALLAPVVAAELAGTSLTRSAVALGVSGLLAAGVWAVVGFNGPVDDTASALPGYVRDVLDSPRDTRALMIELTDDGALAWNVVDARQPQWGTGERNPAGDFSAEFRALVQAFSTGAVPDDVAQQLTALGTSHVWLRGFDPELRAALDNAAGMTSAAADSETVVWTVLGLVSRTSGRRRRDRRAVGAGTRGGGCRRAQTGGRRATGRGLAGHPRRAPTPADRRRGPPHVRPGPVGRRGDGTAEAASVALRRAARRRGGPGRSWRPPRWVRPPWREGGRNDPQTGRVAGGTHAGGGGGCRVGADQPAAEAGRRGDRASPEHGVHLHPGRSGPRRWLR